MNSILSKVGEGLIVGVMVAIVGSITGIVWNEYLKNSEEMKNARLLLEKQTGGSVQQVLINQSINDYMISQKSKNEEILSFIEYQLVENEYIRSKLKDLVSLGYGGGSGIPAEAGGAAGAAEAVGSAEPGGSVGVHPGVGEDSGRFPASTSIIIKDSAGSEFEIKEWISEQNTLDQLQEQQKVLQENSQEQLQIQQQIKR